LQFKRYGSETKSEMDVSLFIFHEGGTTSKVVRVALSVPPAAPEVNHVGEIVID